MLKNMKVGIKLLGAFSLLALLLAATAFLSILFTNSVGTNGMVMGKKIVPISHAAMEIKNTTTHAHLLLEKIGSTDESIDQNLIVSSYKETSRYIDAVLEGTRDAKDSFLPATSSRIIQNAEKLKLKVKTLTDSAHLYRETYNALKTSGTIDTEFSTVYDKLQNRMASIADYFKGRLTQRTNAFLSKDTSPTAGRIKLQNDELNALKITDDAAFSMAAGLIALQKFLRHDKGITPETVTNSFTNALNGIDAISNRLRETTYQSLKQEFTKLAELSGKQMETFTKKLGELRDSQKQLSTNFTSFIQLTDDTSKLIRSALDSGLQKVQTTKTKSQLFMIIFGVSGILLAVFLALISKRAIIVPLNHCIELADGIAAGNLNTTTEKNQKDEFGILLSSLSKMAGQIREILHNIKSSSSILNESAEDIMSGSGELAIRTNEQAASLTETSTTVETFASSLKDNSLQSQEASEILESFNADMISRKALIVNVTDTMTEINESSKKIDNIVAVINDISFQTNLLALNAAVEAARAGEAGRGFAVVATEVRNLAQKTADSSKSIQEIVSQNVEATHKGMDLIVQTSSFFEKIVESLQEMNEKIHSIAENLKDQATGVEQINEAIMQLDTIVNQNAQLVEQFSSNSRSMKSESDQLVNLAGYFTT
jgi:methyl-accepting chemotaxis protein